MIEIAAVGAAMLLLAVAAHQSALALGAPRAEPALSRDPAGGSRVLSPGYRVASAVAAVVVVVAAWVVAARGDVIAPGRLSQGLLARLTWFVGAYLVLAAATDVVPPGVRRRWIGGLAKLTIAVLCVVVAVKPA